MATKKKAVGKKKRTPPRPKSLKGLSPGLRAFWKKQGVK